MSVESIYWTYAELLTIKEQEKAEKFTYSTFEVPDIKDSNGNKYYYAYQTENAGIKTKKYKNIEIKVRGTEISLLDGNYFGCPYFEETMLTLVIPVAGSENGKFDQVPPRSDIEFTILKDFCSENKVGIPANYSACYHTNGDFDNSKPVYTIDTKYNFIVAGVFAESNKRGDNLLIPVPEEGILTKWRNSNPPANYSAQDFMTITDIYEYLNNAGLDDEKICRVCKHANKINLTAGTITDKNPNDTGISEVTLTLTPVKNAIYPKQSANVYKVTTEYSGVYEINLSKTSPISFDLSTINTEGIYSVAISITDGVGHKTEVPVNLIYGTADGKDGNVAPYTPYCIVDNVVEEDTVSEILSNLSEERGGSTPYRVLSEGPVGYYALCIMGEKTMKEGNKNIKAIESKQDFGRLMDSTYYLVDSREEKINNRQIYCWPQKICTENNDTIYHKVLYYSDIFGNAVLIPLD